jgi:hypothetical protein
MANIKGFDAYILSKDGIVIDGSVRRSKQEREKRGPLRPLRLSKVQLSLRKVILRMVAEIALKAGNDFALGNAMIDTYSRMADPASRSFTAERIMSLTRETLGGMRLGKLPGQQDILPREGSKRYKLRPGDEVAQGCER